MAKETDRCDGKCDQGVESYGGCCQPRKGWPTLVRQDSRHQANLQEGRYHIEHLHQQVSLLIASTTLFFCNMPLLVSSRDI